MDKGNWQVLGGVSSDLTRPPEYILPEGVEMTPQLIQQYIDDHKKYTGRFNTLQDYYEGWAEIQLREDKSQSNKANNKVVNPYPKYITDVLTGMFVGEPITYSTSEDEQEALDKIQEYFNLSDEQDQNMELAKMCSVKGEGYELVYLDEDLDIRFNEFEPKEVVYILDDRINPEPLHAIRYIEIPSPSDPLGDKTILQATHYDREFVTVYEDNGSGLVEVSKSSHLMGQVPITRFTNNNERQGDFEQVLPLINAYNKVSSDDLNYIEEFVDAILALYGMQAADDEDVSVIWEDGVVLFGDGQSGEWLTKNMDAKTVENAKTRIDNDIHKFAFVPNLTDEKFAGNVSGEAMKYKLLGIRQVLATKERKFKRSLQRRLELIFHAMRTVGKVTDKGAVTADYTDINITFKQNLPINELENVQMVKELLTFTSKQYALSRLHGLDNPTEEIQAMEEETERYLTLEDAKAAIMQSEVIGDEQN